MLESSGFLCLTKEKIKARRRERARGNNRQRRVIRTCHCPFVRSLDLISVSAEDAEREREKKDDFLCRFKRTSVTKDGTIDTYNCVKLHLSTVVNKKWNYRSSSISILVSHICYCQNDLPSFITTDTFDVDRQCIIEDKTITFDVFAADRYCFLNGNNNIYHRDLAYFLLKSVWLMLFDEQKELRLERHRNGPWNVACRAIRSIIGWWKQKNNDQTSMRTRSPTTAWKVLQSIHSKRQRQQLSNRAIASVSP